MKTELSPRQKEIFIMTANGHKIPYMTSVFKCSETAIHVQKQRAFKRTGVQGIAAITRYCIKKGWIEV